jgi:hypothetical protein
MAIGLFVTLCVTWLSNGGATPPPRQAVPHAEISGQWRYDAKASSTPQMPEAYGAGSDSGSRGGRGHGMGRGGFRGRGDGERSGEGEPGEEGAGGGRPKMNDKQRQGIRATMRLAMGGSRTLEISQTDSVVLLRRPDESDSLVLHTDGRRVKEHPSQGPTIESTTMWASGQLFVQRSVDGGGKVIEIYYREPDDPHLYVVVRVEGRWLDHKLEFRRVYDPISGS